MPRKIEKVVKNGIYQKEFNSFMNRVRNIREVKGISQEQMAELLNMSTSKYCGLEWGISLISLADFIDICNCVKLNPLKELGEILCVETES